MNDSSELQPTSDPLSNDHTWTSNTDQILTLSLFYTRDITSAECVSRFTHRSYIQKLYDEKGELTEQIESRHKTLINLLQEHPELIESSGNFEHLAQVHPTFTACRLTNAGLRLALNLINSFPQKPDFPNWPDNRTMPESS